VFIIVIGGGKVGYYLAKTLAQLKHKITVIETDKALCMNIANTTNNLDIMVMVPA
jgi:trk system potassium uptake protein TrkA